MVKSKDSEQVAVIASELRNISRDVQEFCPPPSPRKLGNLEEAYRRYRDLYGAVSDEAANLRTAVAEAEAKIGRDDPADVVAARVEVNTNAIATFLKAEEKSLSAKFEALRTEWRAAVQADKERYPEATAPYVKGRADQQDWRPCWVSSTSAVPKSNFTSAPNTPHSRALDRLKEGIDLEEALSVIDDDRAELEDRLRDIYQVAQLGIAVEIIGHELETLDVEVRAISTNCRRTSSHYGRTSLPMRRMPRSPRNLSFSRR